MVLGVANSASAPFECSVEGNPVELSIPNVSSRSNAEIGR